MDLSLRPLVKTDMDYRMPNINFKTVVYNLVAICHVDFFNVTTGGSPNKECLFQRVTFLSYQIVNRFRKLNDKNSKGYVIPNLIKGLSIALQ